MTDDRPKSALEIAMARLQKKDADAGVVPVVLSDEQKAEIAEIRNVYQAKLAHAEVLHASAMAALDPEARAVADEEYRRDRERLTSERDRKIERVRQGK